MGKVAFNVLVLLAALSLSLNIVPCGLSQPENVRVLSYDWYFDTYNFFVVVGEVQNVGSSVIDSVVLVVEAYAPDGSTQLRYFCRPTVKYLLPQQKAPFYMDVYYDVLSDLELGIGNIDFIVAEANVTDSYQYPNLEVKDASSTATVEGVYWATGTVKNTGNRTARDIQVYGTFYNAAGSVVATGYSDILSPASLGPSGTASFKVGALDYNHTWVSSSSPSDKISSYSLLIQAKEPVLTGTPPSSSFYLYPTNSSSDPTDPSSPSNPSDSNPLISFSPQFLYFAVFLAVILGVTVTALVLRKRVSEPGNSRKAKSSRKKK